MDIEALAQRTMLVTLNKGSFRAIRQHRAETEAVNDRHHTTGVAKVGVKFCDHRALRDIEKVHNAAYAIHKKLTVPSIQDGFRMLVAGSEFKHSGAMQDFKRQHDALRDEFILDYPTEKANAPARMNGLYDATMWPDDVSDRFHFATSYLPCPSHGAWATWLHESARAATAELKEQLTKAIQHVAARCKASADSRLYQSTFSNLAELVDLIPGLNLADDPIINAMAEKARSLGSLAAEDIKASESARNHAINHAEGILGVFGTSLAA